MSNITFHGEVKEIGGNKILLEDKGTKNFMDFGMSFNAEKHTVPNSGYFQPVFNSEHEMIL